MLAVDDDLGRGPFRVGQHRRAAGQRLDHHQPEGLVPADREQRGPGPGQQPQLLLVGHLADEADVVAQVGGDLLLEVLLLRPLPHLAGQDELDPRLLGRGDGPVGALVGRQASEEDEVVALAVADRGTRWP